MLTVLAQGQLSSVGVGARPDTVTRVLNSKACRGAIMFGDELTQAQQTHLLSELCVCRFPFNCAHGRPSMTPLFTLRAVDQQTRRPPRLAAVRADVSRFASEIQMQ